MFRIFVVVQAHHGEAGRILSHLASTRIIEQVAADTYRATPLSAALTVPKYRDTIVFWYVTDYIAVSSLSLSLSLSLADKLPPSSEAALPVFLEKTGYKDPLVNTASPFQFWHDTMLKSWAWRKERPHIQKAFNNHMAGYHQGRPSWMDLGFNML